MTLTLFLLLGCGRYDGRGEPCACDAGRGFQVCDGGDCTACLCVPDAPSEPEPDYVATFELRPGKTVDWEAVDTALVEGPVLVGFAGGRWDEQLVVARTDPGPHRLVLDGKYSGKRASVAGISTRFANVKRSFVTVRGFEVTGSHDKGIYWRAGDEVIIEDNVIHDNKGSPSLSLDYVSRSGLPSSRFVVRNNHVYDQKGECIYIGGAEGENLDAHALLVLENNLVHDCWSTWTNKTDAINIKDGIGHVEAHRNVLFGANHGMEVASPGRYTHNVVWRVAANGWHIGDHWGRGLNDSVLADNLVVEAGDAGMYVNATNHHWEGFEVDGFTAIGSGEAGIEMGGRGGVTGSLDRLVLVDNAVGLDAWDPMDVVVGSCVVDGNERVADRDFVGVACVKEKVGLTRIRIAGPDNRFFTGDDPWMFSGR